MNNYGIFFSLGDKVIRLPVNPETLPDTLEGDNESYNILGLGEVAALRTPQLRSVEFEGLFPARPEAYVHTPNKFMKPEEYIKFFRDAMYNKSVLTYTPVRYMETGEPFATDDIGFKCYVDAFETEERAGETGDFYYQLTIREYREYTPQSVKIKWYGEESATANTTDQRENPDDLVLVGSIATIAGPYFDTAALAEFWNIGKGWGGDSEHLFGKRCLIMRFDTEYPDVCAFMTMETKQRFDEQMERVNDPRNQLGNSSDVNKFDLDQIEYYRTHLSEASANSVFFDKYHYYYAKKQYFTDVDNSSVNEMTIPESTYVGLYGNLGVIDVLPWGQW